MTGHRSLAVSFVLGLLIFATPIYFLLDRLPAVETVIHFEPDRVFPGQHVQVVWTVKVLRSHCHGRVHRSMIDSQGHIFAFESIAAVIHGVVGTIDTYYYEWSIPVGISPGPAIFRRNTERWCNPLQQWLWPMHEVHEAMFTVLSP